MDKKIPVTALLCRDCKFVTFDFPWSQNSRCMKLLVSVFHTKY